MNFDEFVLRLLDILSRRRLVAALVFSCALIGVVLGAYALPRSYESSAKLLVTLETRRLASTNSEVRDVKASLQPDEVLAAQVELIRTRSAIEQLVDELPPDLFDEPPSSIYLLRLASDVVKRAAKTVNGALVAAMLIDPPDPRRDMVRMIEKRLEVYPIRKAQIIEIVFSHKLPHVAPRVIEGLVSIYQRRQASLAETEAGGMVYTRQAEELDAELARAETRLAEFYKAHDVVDFTAERQMLLDRTSRLDATLGSEDDVARGRVPVSDAAAPPQIIRLLAELDRLTAERSQMRASYTGQHAELRRIDNRIAVAREALQAEREALARTLRSDRARLADMTAFEPELNALGRARAILLDRYEMFRKAAQDRAAFANRDHYVVATLVDPPVPAYAPKGPNRLTLILAGLVLAATLAFIAAVLVDWIANLRRLRRDAARAG